MNNSVHCFGSHFNLGGYPLKRQSVFSRPLNNKKIMVSATSWCPLYALNRVRIFKTNPHIICKQIAGTETNVRYKEESAFQCPRWPVSTVVWFWYEEHRRKVKALCIEVLYCYVGWALILKYERVCSLFRFVLMKTSKLVPSLTLQKVDEYVQL